MNNFILAALNFHRLNPSNFSHLCLSRFTLNDLRIQKKQSYLQPLTLALFSTLLLFTTPFLQASPINATQAPWYVIGKLRVTGQQSCTATLVGPNTIITAAHCIYNRKTKAYFQPSDIHFLAGAQQKTLVAQSVATSYTVATKHLPEGQFDEKALLTDWALVTLKEPIGCMLGALKIAAPEQATKHKLMTAGYPMSDSSQLNAATQCLFALPPKRGSMIRLKNCALEHGDSGAALLATHDKKTRIIGVISAGTNDSKGRYRTFAVPSDQFQKHINKVQFSCNSLQPKYP
jgi:protease YdgD